MKGFNWAYSKVGHKNPRIFKAYIPTATVIEKGEPVDYTQGTGVIVLAGPDDFDDPIYAVSNQEHAANSGTEIELVDPDGQVFKYKCTKEYTLTGGSTTTAVDSSIQPQTNHFWQGGAIRITACAADPSLVGRVVKISDSTGATGSLALAETLPAALAAGDKIQLCPGFMAHNYLGYDLDADAMNPDWDAVGGNVLRIHATNPDTMEVFFIFERHVNVS